VAHNIDLPRHRYCHVIEAAVHRKGREDKTLPCVWWGMSATPGRMFGCHILLESGAIVVDLPLHALRHERDVPWMTQWLPEQAQRWDAYGWHLEELWFLLDHVRDGYSAEPSQHKHHWVVALTGGTFTCVPQDMLLVQELSFTAVDGIPPIKRQSTLWSCE